METKPVSLALSGDGLHLCRTAGVPTLPKNTRYCKGEFIKGPLPMGWLQLAARCSGKTVTVGLIIWFEFGRRNEPVFTLTRAVRKRLSVERKALYHGLSELEKAGLISVVRCNGKNPRIHLYTDVSEKEAATTSIHQTEKEAA